jgi:hypothetical protein
MIAELTASLILGLLVIMRPVDQVIHHLVTQSPYDASTKLECSNQNARSHSAHAAR